MTDASPDRVPLPAGPRRCPWWHWRRWGFTCLIVQTIAAKRQPIFVPRIASVEAPKVFGVEKVWRSSAPGADSISSR